MSKERFIVIGGEHRGYEPASRARRLNLDLEILAELDAFSLMKPSSSWRQPTSRMCSVRHWSVRDVLTAASRWTFLKRRHASKSVKMHNRKVSLADDVDETLKDSVKSAD
jgi:NADPH-dependent 2,4-dienoyl-CoA reductase/sulfur reductase-like enzyme